MSTSGPTVPFEPTAMLIVRSGPAGPQLFSPLPPAVVMQLLLDLVKALAAHHMAPPASPLVIPWPVVPTDLTN